MRVGASPSSPRVSGRLADARCGVALTRCKSRAARESAARLPTARPGPQRPPQTRGALLCRYHDAARPTRPRAGAAGRRGLVRARLQGWHGALRACDRARSVWLRNVPDRAPIAYEAAVTPQRPHAALGFAYARFSGAPKHLRGETLRSYPRRARLRLDRWTRSLPVGPRMVDSSNRVAGFALVACPP